MKKTQNVEELQAIARTTRRQIIEMITAAKSGHPGGSLSAVEILVTLFFDVMNHDPSNPHWPDRDHVILSKGHACPVLYSVMAQPGTHLSMSSRICANSDLFIRDIPTFDLFRRSKHLQVHSGRDYRSVSGWRSRIASTARPSRTYVILGDGEVQEGQIWEAAMFAPFHKVDNLVCIVDYNKIQLDGFVKDILDLEPLAEKWRAFNWHVIELDGHSIPALQKAFAEAAATKGKPTCIVANTIKGKGVSFMENNPKYHGVAPTEQEKELALQEIG